MKLLAHAPFSRPDLTRIERIPARAATLVFVIQTRRPTPRYVLAEDIDHLYATGESRQMLVLRWTTNR